MNFEQMKKILFAEAEKAGLQDYDIYYRVGTDASAEALNREPNAFSFGTSGGISFRCAVDGRIGSASTECMEEAELMALVPRAMANAALVDADEEPIFYAPTAEDVYGTVTAEKPADAPPVMMYLRQPAFFFPPITFTTPSPTPVPS